LVVAEVEATVKLALVVVVVVLGGIVPVGFVVGQLTKQHHDASLDVGGL